MKKHQNGKFNRDKSARYSEDGQEININKTWNKVVNPENGKIRYYRNVKTQGTQPGSYRLFFNIVTEEISGRMNLTREFIVKEKISEENRTGPGIIEVMEFDEDVNWLRENWKAEWGENRYVNCRQLTDEEIEEIREYGRKACIGNSSHPERKQRAEPQAISEIKAVWYQKKYKLDGMKDMIKKLRMIQ